MDVLFERKALERVGGPCRDHTQRLLHVGRRRIGLDKGIIATRLHVVVEVHHGVHQVHELSQIRAERGKVALPEVIPIGEYLAQKQPETVRRLVERRAFRLFNHADVVHSLLDSARHGRASTRRLAVRGAEQSRSRTTRDLPLVVPVVEQLVVREHHRRVGRVFRAFARRETLGLRRMRRAALGAFLLVRLVQRVQKQREKRHVVGKGHAAKLPALVLQ